MQKCGNKLQSAGNQQFPHDTLLVPCSLSVSIGTIGDVTNVESDKVGRVVMVPVAKQIEDEQVLLLDHDGLGDIAE